MNIYNLYIQRNKSNKSLPRVVKNVIEEIYYKQKIPVDVFISPGFLGTKRDTRRYLTDRVFTKNHVKSVSILNSMNQKNAEDYVYELLAQGFSTYISSRDYNKDHRKMIFLTTIKKDKNEKKEAYSKNLYADKFNQCNEIDKDKLHKDYIYSVSSRQKCRKIHFFDFLRNVKVHAIFIGSSNFSKHTYFIDKKDEADLLLFKSEEIRMMIMNTFLNEESSSEETSNEGFLLSRSIHTIPSNFLHNIFRDTII